MSVFVCGDIHGTLDINKLKVYFEDRDDLTKEDYLIICGDVAVCGFTYYDSLATREFLRNLPVTVLFCDGNHENFSDLNSYPVEEWNGGKVHFIESDIIHLMRGQVYEIDGKSFFVFGGAYSIDREDRVEDVFWFREEIPTPSEYSEGWANLEAHDNQVDYVITHTAPFEIISEMGYGSFDEALPQVREFQYIAESIDFEEWFFGHFHEDQDVDEIYHCLWERVIELS